MRWRPILFLGCGILFGWESAAGQSLTGSSGVNVVKPAVDISGQWFLAYQLTDQNGISANAFTLKRGYLTFHKEFNPVLSVRFTQDITVDQEGEDAGNIEMRLKYLYLKMNLVKIPWLSHAWMEAGMIHRPWIDFEEHINDYRLQGPMFVESNEIINSADFGINFVALFGGTLKPDQLARTGSSYPGRYGSLSIGLFNGGGYHALELNRNKTIESRLSLRPFPDQLPGFQISHHFAFGAGNRETQPAFLLNHVALTLKTPRIIAVAQGMAGKGNAYGSLLIADSLPAAFRGASLFGEVYLLKQRLSLLFEYGCFEVGQLNPETTQTVMGGISLHFLNNQKILFNTEVVRSPQKKRLLCEVALEIRF